MKKMLASLAIFGLFGVFANAVTIDTTKGEAYFIAYKMKAKVAVKGMFNDTKFKFGSKSDSISGALKGASATMDPKSVDTKDKMRNKNITETFFSKMKSPIKVLFKDVKENGDKGSIAAVVSMNGKDVNVPMEYTIKDGKFSATGKIDIQDFPLKDEFAALSARCKPFHAGVTWSEVTIGFDAPTK
ncbi:YceI family protein [Helicobacter sp. 11S02596-1]|uniref:YceI family protein n=1 Tax=Helicobacter sp. 11S02596-1 TaxID=1476194 RepID=UPI000BA5F884|nr:YceI family protein [Helicobacter sp. 11S02596-1]PAF42852.1 hypothetical protein BJI48_06250 [Helicobacter sp. 11S02596-1]